MGGDGSGRKPDVIKSVMRQHAEKRQSIANMEGDSIYLPNYSGIQKEALKTATTNNILTATDDGTNITIYFRDTAIMRIVKATQQVQVPAGLDTDTTL